VLRFSRRINRNWWLVQVTASTNLHVHVNLFDKTKKLMTYQPHGKHLIAGDLVETEDKFISQTTDGDGATISNSSVDEVNKAVAGAEEAFASYSRTSRQARAEFLNSVADELDARGADLTDVAMRETALPEARLQGERGRTTGQLRLFATLIEKGQYLDKNQQEALPDRAPVPGPEHRVVQRPIGPVAVFGASNFPLAFSALGGDTAAALAAGCPVVVKGHPAHPGTSEVAADAIHAAIKSHSMHSGVFSLLQSNTNAAGEALVKHPLIKAVGFTGSLRAGRALFDLCSARPEPIPFFGEMGSVNPMFVLSSAAKSRGSEIGAGWAASLTMGAGQFCTNPGIVFGIKGELDTFIEGASEALANAASQTMLTSSIAKAFDSGATVVAGVKGVETLINGNTKDRDATPTVCKTTADVFLKESVLADEVFGPMGLIVEAENTEQLVELAASLEGQLTCTLQMDKEDTPTAGSLMPLLERKAGRVLVNGFPTGVEVSSAMVHGGPYPASTNFGATSVGTLSIRRFLRPVCYQNVPDELVVDW